MQQRKNEKKAGWKGAMGGEAGEEFSKSYRKTIDAIASINWRIYNEWFLYNL